MIQFVPRNISYLLVLRTQADLRLDDVAQTASLRFAKSEVDGLLEGQQLGVSREPSKSGYFGQKRSLRRETWRCHPLIECIQYQPINRIKCEA